MGKKSTVLGLFCLAFIFQISAQKVMYKTGMLLDDKKPAGVEVYEFDDMGFGDKLPDSVSLVEYAPYPGNQGNYASCVGWAYGYCATSILYSQKYNMKNRTAITALAMCPFSVYNRIKNPYDLSCSEGTFLYKGAVELKKQGTKRYHISEVGCNESSPKDSTYRIFKIDNSYAIWDIFEGKNVSNDTKILYTKKALAIKTPVVIGFKATFSFCYGINEDGLWEHGGADMPVGGHAMCVVGYNDKKFGGAFLIQNSWGKEWGNEGYAWVKYKDYAEYTHTAYVIELTDPTGKVAPKKGCDHGDCMNGYSRFNFENGDTYEGDVKGGKPQGSGIYLYKNGDVYTGAFKAGKKEGKGTYYFADGTVKVAFWQADTINEGADYLEYRYGNIKTEKAEFNGYLKGDTMIFGSYIAGVFARYEYNGMFENGMKNGFGVRDYTDYTYVGNLRNDSYNDVYAFIQKKNKSITIFDVRNGFKKLPNEVALASKIPSFEANKADTMATSDKKQCTYGDCENGYGKYTYASGNTYEGFFTNGYRNGYGIYTLKEGGKTSIYQGAWLANKRDGAGKMTLSDGTVFIGEFKDGQKNGYGIYYAAAGKVIAGQWEKNLYQEWDDELGFGATDVPQAKETEAKTEKKYKNKPMTQTQTELK